MQDEDSTRYSSRKPLLAAARRHLGAVGLALVVLATGGMAAAPDGEPRRMSGLSVEGLAGTPVLDRAGRTVGEVVHVDADARGRTRYVRVRLADGGEARIAAFNMWLSDAGVRSELDRDLIEARARAGTPTARAPSA